MPIKLNGVTIFDESNISIKRNVGEIVTSTFPLTDAGLHLLDGSLLQYGSYKAFIDYIADLYADVSYSSIFENEANWQTAVTTYGVCGKFVYNSTNNTVRLPKYNSKIFTGNGNASVIGTGISLGWTDGTHNAGLSRGTGNEPALTDAGFNKAVGTAISDPSLTIPVGSALGIVTDGTKSGLIADLSTITTSLDGYYYIVISSSTKTAIEVDIDEITTDLNGKADVDLTNCTKPHIVNTYHNGTEWYRVWSDGWCEQGGKTEIRNADSWITINLLKSYADTNYTILQTNITSYAQPESGVIDDITASSFKIFAYSARASFWETKGYLPSES